MTRPRKKSCLLRTRGRRLFYKPVNEVGRSRLSPAGYSSPGCVARSLLGLEPASADPANFHCCKATPYPCGRVNRGRHSRCHRVRTHSSRRVSVATRHGDAFAGTADVAYDIVFPFEFALGQVNTEQSAQVRTSILYLPENRTVAGRLTARWLQSQSCSAARWIVGSGEGGADRRAGRIGICIALTNQFFKDSTKRNQEGDL